MAGFPKGHFKHTDESRLKISLGNKGKEKSLEHRKKLSNANKGKVSNWKGHKHSEESKALIREKRKHQTFSFETRKKMSSSRKGSNSPFWKGGVSKINKDERNFLMASFEYRFWRKSIFERDNYTCVWCGDNRGSNLEADHVKSWKDYPELRFAIDNGRTLCKECHKKTSNYGRRKS